MNQDKASRRKRKKTQKKRSGHDEKESNAAAAHDHHHESMIRFQELLEGDSNASSRARNALEATAGNMEMAAAIYFDDCFASNAESDKKMPAARKPHESGESDDDGDDEDDIDGTGDRHPHRKLRRSLDRDFGRAAEEPQEQDEEMIDEDVEGQEDNNNDDDNAGDQNEPADAIAANEARHPIERGGESVSISDDESGFSGWGIVGKMVNDGKRHSARKNRRKNHDLERRIREAASLIAKKVSPKSECMNDEKVGRKRKKEANQSIDEDEDYISDSDWLQEDGVALKSPFEALWGKGNTTTDSSTGEENEAEAEGNVVADEDTEEQQTKTTTGIPQTWLNASFSLSSCGTGMVLKPPKPEDIEFFTWRQQQNQERSSRLMVPPPHHCKAITGILSVVNAMLLTGSTIQGQEVNCTSARKPFSELTPTERKNQFELRLAEALAALIHIAAKSSTARKVRALSRMKASEDKDEIKIQKMQRRLHLIPTCTWEDDPMPQAPDGPSHRNIQVTTSLTNIHDIRLYVLSNIRAFTAPGGVALLLETILRIHGTGVVSRMMKRATKDAKNVPTSIGSLVCCTCEERQKKILEKMPVSQRIKHNNDPSKMCDTTPPGHECITVELMSLLLTGRVETSWKSWEAPGLGFGILTAVPGKVGWQLARPLKPVWVLQGETCYSVIWLDDCREVDLRNVSRLDQPGAVLELLHWHCWYGQRNKSNVRLITAAGKYDPPGLVFKPSADVWQGCRDPMEGRGTVDLLNERRGDKRKSILSAAEHKAMEAKESEAPITVSILEAVKAHPDDMRFYPEKHTMWRFDMDNMKENIGDDDRKDDDDRKQQADHWIPYHRLSARQKLMVEMKLGPRINRILWSRWPNASIQAEPEPIC